jgi:phosphoenolpyruvate carboxylase
MSDIASTAEFTSASPDDAVGNDIRLLGRLLGDAIRHTEGDAVFNSSRRCARSPSTHGGPV